METWLLGRLVLSCPGCCLSSDQPPAALPSREEKAALSWRGLADSCAERAELLLPSRGA